MDYGRRSNKTNGAWIPVTPVLELNWSFSLAFVQSSIHVPNQQANLRLRGWGGGWSLFSCSRVRGRLSELSAVSHTRGLSNSWGIDPRAHSIAKWQNTVKVMMMTRWRVKIMDSEVWAFGSGYFFRFLYSDHLEPLLLKVYWHIYVDLTILIFSVVLVPNFDWSHHRTVFHRVVQTSTVKLSLTGMLFLCPSLLH